MGKKSNLKRDSEREGEKPLTQEAARKALAKKVQKINSNPMERDREYEAPLTDADVYVVTKECKLCRPGWARVLSIPQVSMIVEGASSKEEAEEFVRAIVRGKGGLGENPGFPSDIQASHKTVSGNFEVSLEHGGRKS